MFCECESKCIEDSKEGPPGANEDKPELPPDGIEAESMGNQGDGKSGSASAGASKSAAGAGGKKKGEKVVKQPPDVAKKLAKMWAEHEKKMLQEAGMITIFLVK